MVSDARDYFERPFARVGEFGGSFYWPPGESLVLACALGTIGKSVLVARIVTIAMSVGGVALSALLARELGGPAAERIACLIAALYAPISFYADRPTRSISRRFASQPSAYFGFRALRDQRVGHFGWAGAALGVGCLTRPSMASVVPVLVVAWVYAAFRCRRSLRALFAGGALATCAALVFVLPAQAHDWRSGAGWTIHEQRAQLVARQ